MRSAESQIPAGRVHAYVGRSARVLVTQGAAVVAVFGLNVTLARLLGPAVFAAIGYAAALGTFLVPVCGLGLVSASVRFVAVYRMEQRWDYLRGFLRFSGRLSLAISMGASAVLLLAAAWSHKDVVRAGLVIGAITLPIRSLLSLQQRSLRGFEWTAASLVPDGIARPVTTVLIVVILLWLAHISSMAIGGISVFVGTGFALIASSRLLQRAWRSESREDMPLLRERRRWLHTSVPFIWIGLANVIMNRFDVFVLAGVVGATDLAIYLAAARIATLLLLALGVFEMIALPAFAQSYAARDPTRLERTYLRTIGGVAMITLPFAALVLSVPGAVMGIFGHAFGGGGHILRLLMVGQLVYALGGAGGGLLRMAERERVLARMSAIAALVLVCADLLIIPRYGASGAAWVSLLGNGGLGLGMTVAGATVMFKLRKEVDDG